MRTVVGSDEVAHLWAHQAQETARNPQGNFYFNGESIYSYGRHFEIARHVSHKGQAAILMTYHTYSNTTAKHIHAVRGAIRHLTVFNTNLELRSTLEMFKDYERRQIAALQLAEKSRKGSNKRADALAHAQRLVEEANRFAEFYGLKNRLKTLDIADVEKAVAEAKERAEKAAKAAVAKQRKKFRENLAKWQAGEEYVYLPAHENTYFRFIESGEEIESSHGARFHTKSGKRAYQVLRALKASGKTFQTNGEKILVAPYQVDSMDEKGNVKAGCHRIEWKVIEDFAKQAGWDQEPIIRLPAKLLNAQHDAETTATPELVS